MSLFLTGFLLSLSLCLDIGIVNVAIFKAGIDNGFRPAFEIGIGSTAGDLVYAIISLAGIGLLLKHNWISWILWIGGTAALLILAGRMIAGIIKNPYSLPENNIRQAPGRKGFIYGFVLALSSPTSLIWFATIGGSLIASQHMTGIIGYVFFLSGFVLAAILWSILAAGLSFFSGQLMPGKLKFILSLLSAIIFLVLAVINFMKGYQVLIEPLP